MPDEPTPSPGEEPKKRRRKKPASISRRRKKQPVTSVEVPLNPWDRQPGETPQAFHAFTIYRNLGHLRSHSRVASELLSGGLRRGNPMGVRKDMGIWSRRHRWVERVQAWDREVDRQDQLRQQRDRLEMRKRQADLGQAFQTTLSLPIRALMDKLQTEPELVQRLAQEDIVVLLQLAAQAARALPSVVQVEAQARGEDSAVAQTYQAEEEVDRVAEEERLRRVAAIMQQYGLMPDSPPLPGAAPPPPPQLGPGE